MDDFPLNPEKTGLVIVDIQEKLIAVMGQKKSVIHNIIKLLHLASVYHLPILLTEQNPQFLGGTLEEIKSMVPAFEAVQKLHFDCCEVEAFNRRLNSLNLNHVILTGIESHVCLFQTCLSLIKKGYNVQVPRDAVDSRTIENKQTGLDLMKENGAVITSTETIIFQMLQQAGTKEFKEMLKVVK